MADYELECNECGWQGRESALENQTVESERKAGESLIASELIRRF
jgi:hypothetical protein